jgi:hypothetical protein
MDIHDFGARMRNMENHARFDVRKVLVGGVLAWIIQAAVLFFYRLP